MTIDFLLMTYSGSEILDLARKGLLNVDGHDVSQLVCAATEKLYTEDQYEAYGDACYDRGYDWGRIDGNGDA